MEISMDLNGIQLRFSKLITFNLLSYLFILNNKKMF